MTPPNEMVGTLVGCRVNPKVGAADADDDSFGLFASVEDF